MYAQRIDDNEVLTEVVLPDGRSLKFRYNQFGEVAEAELPTGGRIQYDHGFVNTFPTGNSPIWETTTGGIGGGITTDVKFVDRGVKARRTYPDGVNLEGKWAYGYANSTSTISARNAADVLLLDEVHYFLSGTRCTEYPFSPGRHDGTHYSVWSTGVEWRKEIKNASGVVIAATEQDWSQRTPVSWVGYPTEQPAQDNRVNQSRKYLDNGMMAKVETFYDQYNNPTEVKEYDFDQTLKRRTITTYLTANNGYNYATDDSIHMLGLPLQQSVYNGGGAEQARTSYEYDNYTNDGLHAPLVDYGSVTQHDPRITQRKPLVETLPAWGAGSTTGSTIWTYHVIFDYFEIKNLNALQDSCDTLYSAWHIASDQVKHSLNAALDSWTKSVEPILEERVRNLSSKSPEPVLVETLIEIERLFESSEVAELEDATLSSAMSQLNRVISARRADP